MSINIYIAIMPAENKKKNDTISKKTLICQNLITATTKLYNYFNTHLFKYTNILEIPCDICYDIDFFPFPICLIFMPLLLEKQKRETAFFWAISLGIYFAEKT